MFKIITRFVTNSATKQELKEVKKSSVRRLPNIVNSQTSQPSIIPTPRHEYQQQQQHKQPDIPRDLNIKAEIRQEIKCFAHCTARRYDLDKVATMLHTFNNGYTIFHKDYIYAALDGDVKTPSSDPSNGEVFFFKDGIMVTWNTDNSKTGRLLEMLRGAEIDRFPVELQDVEEMCGIHDTSRLETKMSGEDIVLATVDPAETILTKLAFSHGVARSTQLGVLENHLSQYLDSIKQIPSFIMAGKEPPLTQKQVMMKQGQLLYIRGLLNLHSDLVDMPEFYWTRTELGKYFESINRVLDVDLRIRVLNQRMDHANRLVDLMTEHMARGHGTRMEQIIIALIAVEVMFELLHYLDKLGYIDMQVLSRSHNLSTPSLNLRDD